jgi:hypothetical protein
VMVFLPIDSCRVPITLTFSPTIFCSSHTLALTASRGSFFLTKK